MAVAFFANDEHVHKYSIALSTCGILASIYNIYLQLGGANIGVCGVGSVSCQQIYFTEYGYITIPVMALTSYAVLLILMLFRRNARQSLLD